MYYYIAEPITTKTEKKKIDEIQSILSQLGIAGEFAIASPARSVEENLELAFKKGFTTVVGIGSDALANQIASAILRTEGQQATIGFIPLNPSQHLCQMIGTSNTRDACTQLRTRYIATIDALQLNPKHAIITDADITLTSPVRFLLHYRGSVIQGQFTDAKIERIGKITLSDKTYQPSQVRRSFFEQLFGGTPKSGETTATTIIQASRWQLETETPCNVAVDHLTVGQTPLDAITKPKALKLITKRDKLAKEKE